MSSYDKIESASGLVNEARMHGFSTRCEDVCRAQDIFGHSTEEQLSDLATGKDSATFYLILKNIWDTERVFRFWNQHNNPEHVELVAARKSIKNLQANAENDKKSFMDMKAQRDEAVNVATERLAKVLQYQREAKEMELEIMSLKAKLYDLMTASK